jgi:processive 1,2-diacylglycerol beta-glucosyltransferase
MKRLLVLSAGAGAGHNRAAEALHETAKLLCPGLETAWLDSLRYTNAAFSKLYARSFAWIAARSPGLWGVLYHEAGRGPAEPHVRRLLAAFERLAYRKLARAVEDFRPDAVACTHFLPASVLLAKRIGVPVHVVLTDFDAHPLWVHPGAASTFAASLEVKVQLVRQGLDASRVRVTGIPIHPAFAEPSPRGAPPRPRILFMGGGLGMGPMEEILDRLLQMPVPADLVVVAGRNEPLRKRLERAAAGRARVLGFVDTIPELMAESDLIVTKAGGLTVSECLARRLPMVLCSPVPGQEEANADFLVEQGCAVKARRPELVDFKVHRLLEDPDRLDMMRRACASAARPRAARDVLRHVIDEHPARG